MRAYFRIPLFLLIILSSSTPFISSCNKASEAQIQKLDSLQALVDQAEQSLNLDTAEIKKRSSSMREAMMRIRRYYSGGYTEDLARDMDAYRGIQKIYDRFLDAYPTIQAETGELKTQARNLRYTTKKGKFNETEFEKNYQVEYSDALKNAENVRIYIYPVYDSEPHYKRIQPRVDSMLTLSVPTGD